MNFLIKIFGGTYDDLWKAIIRPSKDEYTQEELGPYKFELKGKCYKRTDFELINKRSQKIECSFWEPFDEEREKPRLPCVIYLHGNSSSRCEAYPEVKYLLQRNITIFAFDFCGCGKSEGEYISLGYYEKKDVHCVIEYLLKSKKVSKIGLWGRSMGAVTAIMYANEHPQLIDAMVLDSGFYSLKQLIKELIESKIKLPEFIYDKVLNMVKETVKEKAKFDMDIIEPYIYAKNCLVPAFFCHGNDDNFVLPHHCKDLFNEYKCEDKICEMIKGSHNTSRPKELRIKACDFLEKYLRDDDLQSNETINNSNTYERIEINTILKASSEINNLSKSVNAIKSSKTRNNNLNNITNKKDKDKKDKIKREKERKDKEKKDKDKERKDKDKKDKDNNIIHINNNINNYSFRDYLNDAKMDEITFNQNNNNINVNASYNMKTYSHNKYSRNNLKLINKKNTAINMNDKKQKLYGNKIEENISSSSSSNKEDKNHIYQKKHIKKDPFNSLKINTVTISNYFDENNPKIDIKKMPIVNKNIYVKTRNKVNNINTNINNNKQISNSFLNSVIMNTPNVKNNKNITITNSLLNSFNKNSRNYKMNKNINKERTFTDNFLLASTDNKNIIQNNYYYTNNIYLNKYMHIRPKKKKPEDNFSYTLKKPLDKYSFKTHKINKMNNKNKLMKKNDNKINLIFKSIDAKNSKYSNSIKNIIKSIADTHKNKIIQKKSVNSIDNHAVLGDNDESFGRNIPH